MAMVLRRMAVSYTHLLWNEPELWGKQALRERKPLSRGDTGEGGCLLYTSRHLPSPDHPLLPSKDCYRMERARDDGSFLLESLGLKGWRTCA